MSLREKERSSIYEFLKTHLHLVTGDILDLGAGKQPYRDLVSPCGDYYPWDRAGLPDNHVGDLGSGKSWPGGQWDTIICTQVIQLIPDVMAFLDEIHAALRPTGVLLMTGPTNWPVVQPSIDLRRWTVAGITEDLVESGFSDIEVTERASVSFEGERWSLGWGAVARVRNQLAAA